MNIFQILVLSLVEGLTEFLPVSSTGHLMIVSDLLNIVPSHFSSSFNIFIQLGALLAVVFLYFKRFLNNNVLLAKIGLAFIPTALVGYFLYPIIKNIFLESLKTVSISLFVGGVILILFELYLIKTRPITDGLGDIKPTEVSFKQAVIIGVFQSLAVIPGVSRAGATIVGGLALGLSRQTIIEFSFFLAVPTILGATFYDLLKTGTDFSLAEYKVLAVGFVFSFVFAYLSVRWLIRFIANHNFIWFGVYRIVLAIIIWFWII